jgi:hypothetical protein
MCTRNLYLLTLNVVCSGKGNDWIKGYAHPNIAGLFVGHEYLFGNYDELCITNAVTMTHKTGKVSHLTTPKPRLPTSFTSLRCKHQRGDSNAPVGSWDLRTWRSWWALRISSGDHGDTLKSTEISSLLMDQLYMSNHFMETFLVRKICLDPENGIRAI